jgi:hypothetical protein
MQSQCGTEHARFRKHVYHISYIAECLEICDQSVFSAR